ncbi:uncharacterized protein LOC117305677 [Asterias rubens]|uniref:uncharacterized protein LOC117305677 n=1 Tax=Asterias rubens TaxID=7604 RepID=UPI0014553E5A|nr:uncharacterized protein LOC117305677 [Asterias rubens]
MEEFCENQRNPNEPARHWNARKQFIVNNWDRYHGNQLASLAMVWLNIEFYGCTYPPELMQRVQEMAKGITLDVTPVDVKSKPTIAVRTSQLFDKSKPIPTPEVISTTSEPVVCRLTAKREGSRFQKAGKRRIVQETANTECVRLDEKRRKEMPCRGWYTALADGGTVELEQSNCNDIVCQSRNISTHDPIISALAENLIWEPYTTKKNRRASSLRRLNPAAMKVPLKRHIEYISVPPPLGKSKTRWLCNMYYDEILVGSAEGENKHRSRIGAADRAVSMLENLNYAVVNANKVSVMGRNYSKELVPLDEVQDGISNDNMTVSALVDSTFKKKHVPIVFETSDNVQTVDGETGYVCSTTIGGTTVATGIHMDKSKARRASADIALAFLRDKSSKMKANLDKLKNVVNECDIKASDLGIRRKNEVSDSIKPSEATNSVTKPSEASQSLIKSSKGPHNVIEPSKVCHSVSVNPPKDALHENLMQKTSSIKVQVGNLDNFILKEPSSPAPAVSILIDSAFSNNVPIEFKLDSAKMINGVKGFMCSTIVNGVIVATGTHRFTAQARNVSANNALALLRDQSSYINESHDNTRNVGIEPESKPSEFVVAENVVNEPDSKVSDLVIKLENTASDSVVAENAVNAPDIKACDFVFKFENTSSDPVTAANMESDSVVPENVCIETESKASDVVKLENTASDSIVTENVVNKPDIKVSDFVIKLENMVSDSVVAESAGIESEGKASDVVIKLENTASDSVTAENAVIEPDSKASDSVTAENAVIEPDSKASDSVTAENAVIEPDSKASDSVTAENAVIEPDSKASDSVTAENAVIEPDSKASDVNIKLENPASDFVIKENAVYEPNSKAPDLVNKLEDMESDSIVSIVGENTGSKVSDVAIKLKNTASDSVTAEHVVTEPDIKAFDVVIKLENTASDSVIKDNVVAEPDFKAFDAVIKLENTASDSIVAENAVNETDIKAFDVVIQLENTASDSVIKENVVAENTVNEPDIKASDFIFRLEKTTSDPVTTPDLASNVVDVENTVDSNSKASDVIKLEKMVSDSVVTVETVVIKPDSKASDFVVAENAVNEPDTKVTDVVIKLENMASDPVIAPDIGSDSVVGEIAGIEHDVEASDFVIKLENPASDFVTAEYAVIEPNSKASDVVIKLENPASDFVVAENAVIEPDSKASDFVVAENAVNDSDSEVSDFVIELENMASDPVIAPEMASDFVVAENAVDSNSEASDVVIKLENTATDSVVTENAVTEPDSKASDFVVGEDAVNDSDFEVSDFVIGFENTASDSLMTSHFVPVISPEKIDEPLKQKTSPITVQNHSAVVPSKASDSDIEPSKASHSDIEPSKASHSDIEPSKVSHSDIEPSKASDSDIEPSKVSHSEIEPSKASHFAVVPSKASHSDIEPSKASDSDIEPSKASHSDIEPSKVSHSDIEPSKASHSEIEPSKASHSDIEPSKASHSEIEPSKASHSEIEPSKVSHSDIEPSKASHSDIEPSKVSHSDIEPSKASHSDIEPSKASHSDIEPSKASHSEIEPSKASHSDIEPSKASHSDIEPSKASHSDIEPSKASHSDIEPSKASHSDIEPSKVSHSDIEPSKVSHSDIEPSKASHSDIEPSKVSHSDIEPSKASHSDIEPSKVSHSDIEPSKASHSDIEPSKVSHSDIEPSKVSHSDIEPSKVSHSDIEPSKASHSDIEPSKASHSDIEPSKASHFAAVPSKASHSDIEPSRAPHSDIEPSKASHSDIEPSRAPHSDIEPSKVSHSDIEPSKASHSDIEPSRAPHSDIEPSKVSHSDIEPSKASDCDIVPRKASHSVIVPSKASHSDIEPCKASYSDIEPSKASHSVVETIRAFESVPVNPSIDALHENLKQKSSPINIQNQVLDDFTLFEPSTPSPSASILIDSALINDVSIEFESDGFVCSTIINGTTVATGIHMNKREARNVSADNALALLRQHSSNLKRKSNDTQKVIKPNSEASDSSVFSPMITDDQKKEKTPPINVLNSILDNFVLIEPLVRSPAVSILVNTALKNKVPIEFETVYTCSTIIDGTTVATGTHVDKTQARNVSANNALALLRHHSSHMKRRLNNTQKVIETNSEASDSSSFSSKKTNQRLKRKSLPTNVINSISNNFILVEPSTPSPAVSILVNSAFSNNAPIEFVTSDDFTTVDGETGYVCSTTIDGTTVATGIHIDKSKARNVSADNALAFLRHRSSHKRKKPDSTQNVYKPSKVFHSVFGPMKKASHYSLINKRSKVHSVLEPKKASYFGPPNPPKKATNENSKQKTSPIMTQTGTLDNFSLVEPSTPSPAVSILVNSSFSNNVPIEFVTSDNFRTVDGETGFVCSTIINGTTVATGIHANKREARNVSADNALVFLRGQSCNMKKNPDSTQNVIKPCIKVPHSVIEPSKATHSVIEPSKATHSVIEPSKASHSVPVNPPDKAINENLEQKVSPIIIQNGILDNFTLMEPANPDPSVSILVNSAFKNNVPIKFVTSNNFVTVDGETGYVCSTIIDGTTVATGIHINKREARNVSADNALALLRGKISNLKKNLDSTQNVIQPSRGSHSVIEPSTVNPPKMSMKENSKQKTSTVFIQNQVLENFTLVEPPNPAPPVSILIDSAFKNHVPIEFEISDNIITFDGETMYVCKTIINGITIATGIHTDIREVKNVSANYALALLRDQSLNPKKTPDNTRNVATELDDKASGSVTKTGKTKIGPVNPSKNVKYPPIKETNVGYKMLRQMGWEGGALQKDGIVDPIQASLKFSRGGLGFVDPKPKFSKPLKPKVSQPPNPKVTQPPKPKVTQPLNPSPKLSKKKQRALKRRMKKHRRYERLKLVQENAFNQDDRTDEEMCYEEIYHEEIRDEEVWDVERPHTFELQNLVPVIEALYPKFAYD